MTLPFTVHLTTTVPALPRIVLAQTKWQPSGDGFGYFGGRVGTYKLVKKAETYTLTRINSTATTPVLGAIIHVPYPENLDHVLLPHLCGVEIPKAELGQWSPRQGKESYPGFYFEPIVVAVDKAEGFSPPCTLLGAIKPSQRVYIRATEQGMELEFPSLNLGQTVEFTVLSGVVEPTLDRYCYLANVARGCSSILPIRRARLLMNVQTQDWDDPRGQAEKLWKECEPWADLALFWGQMSDRYREDAVGTGCCLPKIPLHPRNSTWLPEWMLSRREDGLRCGLYSRPDGEDIKLRDWLRHNASVGASIHYVDHITSWLESNLVWDIGVAPPSSIVEWPSTANATLVSGCYYRQAGQPKRNPNLARFLYNRRVFVGPGHENWDYAGAGEAAGFNTEIWCHLHDGIHTTRTKPNWLVKESIAAWQSVGRVRGDLVFRACEGLSDVPPGVAVHRWNGEGRVVLAVDAYNYTGGEGTWSVKVDGREIDLPLEGTVSCVEVEQ